MKKIISLFAVIGIVALSLIPAFAHSGRTDSKGGHYDRSTGKYHYHHGYSAHQHPNGVCPYEDDEEEFDDGIDWDTDEQTTVSSNTKSKGIFTVNNLPDKFYVDYDWYYLDVLHLVLTIILDVSLIFCYIQYLYNNRKYADFYTIFLVAAMLVLWIVTSLLISLCIEFTDVSDFLIAIPFYIIGLIAVPVLSFVLSSVVSFIVEKVRGY